MTLKSDIDQLAADAVLMHQVMHGDATTTVTTAGGPVRSVAKLIADKDAEINVSADGILAQSVAQVGFATQQAIAAGNSLSQVTIAVAQALSAAGTAQTYSTALAAIASQSLISPSAVVTGFNGTVLASCFINSRDNSDGGVRRAACIASTLNLEPTTATGKNLGKLANLAAAWAVAGAAVGDHYYDQTAKLFYSIGGTSAAPTRAEIFATARRDIPELIAATVEANRLILWDATDVTLPMWRVFKTIAYNVAGAGVMGYTHSLSCCVASEGMLIVGSNFSSSGYYGSVVIIDLYGDTAYAYSGAEASVGFTGRWKTGLGNRHVLGGYDGSALPAVPLIVNSVAAYVYPNAPFNSLNGLKKPTIAVGATAGVTVLKDDDTAINITYTSYGQVNCVWFGREGALWFTNGNVLTQQYYTHAFNTLPAASVADGVGYVKGSADIYYSTAWNVAYTGLSTLLSPGYLNIASAVNASGVTAFACGGGLFLTKDNPSNPTASMMAAITTTSNTGWQVNGLGCWLADTVVDTVSGTPVIASTFAGTGNLDGWTLEATATNNAGVNMFDATSGAATNVLATRVITGLTAGKNYVINFSRPGIYSCSLGILGISAAAFTAAAGTAAYQFVASSASHTVVLYSSAAVQRGQFGAISLAECSADRSAKGGNPLTVFGNGLTKIPVGTGNQLVAWGGFAGGVTPSYLEGVYTPLLDFPGDFCLPVWFNPTTANQTGTMYCRSPLVLAGNSFKVGLVNGVASFGRSIAGAAWVENTLGYTPPINKFTLGNLVRVNGVISLRVDGVPQATTIADVNNYTNTSAVFTVGVDNTHNNPFIGQMALLRASATPANADQAMFRYKDEHEFFKPGTQVCLYGTSNVLSSVTHDQYANVIQAGSVAGFVTKLQGLRVISSYASTVGAVVALSAKGGHELLIGAAGVSYSKPSRLYTESIERTYDQRRHLMSVPVTVEFDALAGQTTFTGPLNYSLAQSHIAGTRKRRGTGKDYTVTDDGFRQSAVYAVTPGAGAWLSNDYARIV